MFIDELDDIVSKYNNTYHSATKMKPIHVKSSTLILKLKVMIKVLNLKLFIMWEYQKIKVFLKKVTLQIGQRMFCWKKLKSTVQWIYEIQDINDKEIVGTVYEKELQKKIKQRLRWKSNKDKKW